MANELTGSPDLAFPTTTPGVDSGGRPPVLIRASGISLRKELVQLGAYWELLYFLVWRDTKVRYKQTAIGAAWAVLQPLATMAIFTVVFSRLVGVPSDGVPYPVFAYTGLLPWSYFSAALTRSSNSLVGNGNLITKVYFPRLIIPLSAVVSPLVDFAVAFLLLVGLMVWFQTAPTVGVLAIPLFLLLCTATALAVSLWLSALCVRYRDVGVIIPFLIQVWMYVSPVAYPVSLVPEKWRLVYSLNPMVGVIEGFRWAMLGGAVPDLTMIALNCVGVGALMCGGVVYFTRAERVFADVV